MCKMEEKTGLFCLNNTYLIHVKYCLGQYATVDNDCIAHMGFFIADDKILFFKLSDEMLYICLVVKHKA